MYKNERLDKEAQALLNANRALEREKDDLKEHVSNLNHALVRSLLTTLIIGQEYLCRCYP
jgi:FtsZ-binding cell division protein ZapB